MAPTPANQAIAVPILCNVARRPAGFDAGAADERLSDSSSSVGISKIAILNCDPPSPDAGTVVLSVAEVAIERPSKWECVRHRPRYLCDGPNLRAIPHASRWNVYPRHHKQRTDNCVEQDARADRSPGHGVSPSSKRMYLVIRDILGGASRRM